MEYKLHRVAPNSLGWMRPSPGRLGQKGVGDYVKGHGFGHEDWNFNRALAVSGTMLGYTAAQPAVANVGKKFGLVLATYDEAGWRAAGYYEGATFLPTSTAPDIAAVQEMAVGVFELARQSNAAPRFKKKTLSQIEDIIKSDFSYFRWSIPKRKVFVFDQPVAIPPKTFNPGRQRMSTSFNLTKQQFDAIIKLGPSVVRPDDDLGEEEGSRVLKLHWALERKTEIVADFKRGLSSFACTVCEFDFGATYGDRGACFIECHHTKPVAQMKPGDRTQLKDLRAVCSNCHRMIHSRSPMLTIEELRQIVLQNRDLP